MRWPGDLQRLCGKVGDWACRAEKERLGQVTGRFRVEELNSR